LSISFSFIAFDYDELDASLNLPYDAPYVDDSYADAPSQFSILLHNNPNSLTSILAELILHLNQLLMLSLAHHIFSFVVMD
jgi:hypothetical protein